MYYINPWIFTTPAQVMAEITLALELIEQDEFDTWGDHKVPAVMMDYQDR